MTLSVPPSPNLYAGITGYDIEGTRDAIFPGVSGGTLTRIPVSALRANLFFEAGSHDAPLAQLIIP